MTTSTVSRNKIFDKDITTLFSQVGTDTLNTFPLINFVQDLEFYAAAKYTSSIADPVTNTLLRVNTGSSAISGNDKWKNDNDNYQCADAGMFTDFTASPRTCGLQANSHFVFVSPPINTSTKKYVDLSTKAISAETSKEVTIKIFVKFLGLTYLLASDVTSYTGGPTDEVDFFRYGSKLRMTLKRVSTTRMDLILRNQSHQTISTFENFETRIGKWTHITLSYSSYWDASNQAIWNYYPDKLNWQVGNKQMTILQGTFDKLPIADLLTLTIPKEVIALWTKGMINYDYFTGFMGIYSSLGDTTLTYSNVRKSSTADKTDIYKGTSTSDCLDTTNYFTSATVSALTYNCVRDYDFQIYETSTTYNCGYTALGETACLTTNNNCPLGYVENAGDICSCSNNDKKLMLINKNAGKNKCQSIKNLLTYIINFFHLFL